MMAYINYTFDDLLFSDDYFIGKFISRDSGVYCEFCYDRNNHNFEIWNNTLPEEEILPLPMGWLECRLKEKGNLESRERKISY